MIYLIIAIFGLVIGSFIGVLIYRIPKNISIIKPASFCDSCGKRIPIYYNIPILGYALLGGKCSHCKNKISIMLPVVEILCTFIFIAVFLKVGIGIQALFLSLGFCLLLALSIIDMQTLSAPDSINFTALGCFLIFSLTSEAPIDLVLSSLAVSGLFSLVRMFIGMIKNEEALGEADIIVGAMLGAMLGFNGALNAVFVGCCLALPVALFLKKHNQTQVPFIPFLALGGFTMFII